MRRWVPHGKPERIIAGGIPVGRTDIFPVITVTDVGGRFVIHWIGDKLGRQETVEPGDLLGTAEENRPGRNVIAFKQEVNPVFGRSPPVVGRYIEVIVSVHIKQKRLGNLFLIGRAVSSVGLFPG